MVAEARRLPGSHRVSDPAANKGEHVTEDLLVGDGNLLVPTDPVSPSIGDCDRFSFALHKHPLTEGPDGLVMWSMPRATVYPTRGRAPKNLQPILDYYLLKQKAFKRDAEPDVQETYILASLLRWVRSGGSRKVIADSAQRVTRGPRLNRLITDLNDLLAGGRHSTMDGQTFADKTAGLIGPVEYDAEFRARYEQMAALLLEPARAMMREDARQGARLALDRWLHWVEGFGRHRGHELDKRVLDVLSYESRAAFHQAYSEVWIDLVSVLAHKYQWPRATVRFHLLWHTQRRYPAQQEGMGDFHLFHGHVLALHPATDLLLLTKTGVELVRDAMEPKEDPVMSQSALYRLLNGLFLAVYFYDERRRDESDRRRQRP
jgi:hypothetical protein